MSFTKFKGTHSPWSSKHCKICKDRISSGIECSWSCNVSLNENNDCFGTRTTQSNVFWGNESMQTSKSTKRKRQGRFWTSYRQTNFKIGLDLNVLFASLHVLFLLSTWGMIVISCFLIPLIIVINISKASMCEWFSSIRWLSSERGSSRGAATSTQTHQAVYDLNVTPFCTHSPK